SVMEKIATFFPGLKPQWTATAALPGGDFPYAEAEKRISDFQKCYPFLKPGNARRIFRAYGTRAERMLDGARSSQDLGENFGPLGDSEVEYLENEEWARVPEDILWRRSKLGLHLSAAEQAALNTYMGEKAGDKIRKKASSG